MFVGAALVLALAVSLLPISVGSTLLGVCIAAATWYCLHQQDEIRSRATVEALLRSRRLIGLREAQVE